MDSTDPTEPIDRNEPVDPMDSADPNDPTDRKDAALNADRALAADPADAQLRNDANESDDPDDAIDRTFLNRGRGAGAPLNMLDMITPIVFDTVKCAPVCARRLTVSSTLRKDPHMTDDTRERLLAAARDELDEHGVDGLSLRAVARLAGVSHALPKYHFGDRAGLLTAVAARGFDGLTETLTRARARARAQAAAHAADDGKGDAGATLLSLGRAYVDYGLTHRAVFDLMFRPTELHPDDPDLVHAQRASIGVLAGAVPDASGEDPSPTALMAWTFAHGLVVLVRDGALTRPNPDDAGADSDEIVGRMLETFGTAVGFG